MSQSSTITTKGQITIPKKLRKDLGLKPKEKVFFQRQGRRIIIEPLPDFLTLGGFFRSKKKMPDLKKLRKKIQADIARNVITERQ